MESLAPFGLRPVFFQSGRAVPTAYPGGITSGYAVDIFRGTPVYLDTNLATSQIRVAAASGADFIGSFAGVEYTNSQGQRVYSPYWPASQAASEIVAYVYDDPMTVFEAQAVGSLAQTALGDQCNFSLTSGYTVGAGSTVTGNSAAGLDPTPVGAGSQGQVRIINKSFIVGNDWGDTYTRIWARIARHQYVSNKVAI